MNEQEARAYFRKFVGFLRDTAVLIPGEYDDRAVEMLEQALESDFIWGLVWGLVDQWFEADEPYLVRTDSQVITETAKVGLDITTIIMLIKLGLEVWKAIRK